MECLKNSGTQKGTLYTQVIAAVVWSLSCFWFFPTPWTAAHKASWSFTNLQKFAQTHVHGVDDAIQPSHPLSPSYPPVFNLSQHQGLFQWVHRFEISNLGLKAHKDDLVGLFSLLILWKKSIIFITNLYKWIIYIRKMATSSCINSETSWALLLL